MANEGKKPGFASFFSEGQYQTQPETVYVKEKNQKVTIGIPKETILQENRVALVPNSVRTLIGYGHEVIVESGAGDKSNFSDHDFSEAGATITNSTQEVFKCQVLIKAAPPTMEEIDMSVKEQMIISPLDLPVINSEYLKALQKKHITAVAMEYYKSEDGSFPIVRIMSEIAGMDSILTAAELLSTTNGGRGVLLGGVSGVPPAKVVILGAGVVGEFATKTALGLGASVRIFDNSVSKLMRIQSLVGRQLHTSTYNPVYLGYQLMSADVVIGAVHSKDGRAPILVTDDMISKMKEGSVAIDVSIDQGGCFATSKVTSHKKPTFVEHGVIHYCVPNIASKVPRTASVAISNIITSVLIKVGASSSFESLLFDNRGIRNGVYTYKGCLTNVYLANKYSLKFTDINLLLMSRF